MRSSVRLAAALSAALSFSALVHADSPADLEQLQHEWWQWVMSIPASDSPVYDKTGNRCGVAQRGEVWFLAGNTGGRATRQCTVPVGVKLLVPIVNNFCFPDAAYTDAACTADTIAFIDGFAQGTILLEVDGTPQAATRVSDTSDFGFTVGVNGFGGVKPGVYRATVADGHWALLDPLGPGQHTLRIVAQGPTFGLDITYELTVVAPDN